MLKNLLELEKRGKSIKVGLIGAGAMGRGIAIQINKVPGMKISFIADINIQAAYDSALVANFESEQIAKVDNCFNLSKYKSIINDGGVVVTDDCSGVLENQEILPYDVLVESSNTISDAAQYCLKAISNKSHVILMNAEVDLFLGKLLKHEADKNGVIVTSDAGDQHGVLIRLLEEVKLYGLRLVQAGNIKGFLNRYATSEDLIFEAKKRNLNPIQCCAYTDGTKLAIEMALVANATGMNVQKSGMIGPKCKKVEQVLDLFDFDSISENGSVDYILGAEPGGGVYVVAHENDNAQKEYLQYYKMGDGPYYLFYKHYHLCHFETPIAIYKAIVEKEALLNHWQGDVANVNAYAKKDLEVGDLISHAIGGDELYGLIENNNSINDFENKIPIGNLEAQGNLKVKIIKPIKKDQAITLNDVCIPDTTLSKLLKRQSDIVSAELLQKV